MGEIKRNLAFRIAYFLILLVVSTTTVGLTLADGFKTYRAEKSIIFLPQNEKIAVQTDLAIENLKELAKKMSAGDLEIIREGKSSILTLAVFGSTAQEAETNATKAATKLIDVASKYYNIKTEADFRILEGNPPARIVIKDKIKLSAISLVLGLILSLLLYYIFSELGEKVVQFLLVKKKQIMTMGIGWAFDQSTNFAFDFILYPFAISFWGLKIGGAVMIFLSIVLSIGIIRFYDRSRKDWLGIEALKSLRDNEHKGKLGKLIGWLMKKGDPVALIGLSIFYSEPVAITLYMRRGAYQYNGFSSRDWAIFISSVAISNVSWALAVWGGVEAFRAIF